MIIGDGVRFRGIEKEDLPFYVKWLNDPEVRRGLSLLMPLSLAEEEQWFADLSKRSPFERPMAIVIQPDPNKDRWVFIGNCGFIDITGKTGQQRWEFTLAKRNFGTKDLAPKLCACCSNTDMRT